MITSKQIIKLSDEFVSDVKGNSGAYTGLFVNPTSTDFKDLFKNVKSSSVRFIADNNNKKVYVWDSYLAIHSRILDELSLYSRYTRRNDSDLFISGVGQLIGGKVVMFNSDVLEADIRSVLNGSPSEKREMKNFLKLLIETNWSWLNKYVDCSKYFDKIRRSLA